MPDQADSDDWDAAVAALAAAGPPPPKRKRGPATDAQRAAMKAATDELSRMLYVVADTLDAADAGSTDHDGIYLDPERELKMIVEAKLWLDRALDKMQSTDWCLEPVSKPDTR